MANCRLKVLKLQVSNFKAFGDLLCEGQTVVDAFCGNIEHRLVKTLEYDNIKDPEMSQPYCKLEFEEETLCIILCCPLILSLFTSVSGGGVMDLHKVHHQHSVFCRHKI